MRADSPAYDAAQATARTPSITTIGTWHMSAVDPDTNDRLRRRRMEVFAFLLLTAVLMPALAVATVGSYGLTVWLYQTIAGPPGPPAR